MVCHLEVDDRPWTVQIAGGQLQLRPGEPPNPDVSLRTDPKTLNTLLEDPTKLRAAEADGTATVTGDPSALQRLLDSVAVPPVAAG
jgi:hypothetical protein